MVALLAAPIMIGDASADQVVRSAAATKAALPANSVEVSVEVSEPVYDELQKMLDEEARAAMNSGDFKRAWHYFWRLLVIDPTDTRALREAGRVASALGKLDYAVATFTKLDALNGTAPDPEIHFLRGEALMALGRKWEAERAFGQTERELHAAPIDRRGVMWLARIAALRQNLPAALELYGPLIPEDRKSAEYAEVMLSIVEAHTLSKDWATAEQLLRRFRVDQPDHARGRELLAWVLGARGNVKEELGLRVGLASEWDDHPRKTAEYAQALERHYDYSGALDRYREARSLGVRGIDADIDRMRLRTAPELGGGVTYRGDGSGTILGWHAGGSVPLGSWLRFAVNASQDTARGGVVATEVTSTAAAGWLSLSGDRGELAAIGATVRESSFSVDRGLGASAIMRSSPERRVQLQLRGDVNMPWRESSSTIREDGVVDAVTAQLSATPWSRRFLLILAGQGRRLGLAPAGEMAETLHARQLLGAVGFDLTVAGDPSRAARGEILDNELLVPRGLSDAIVVSYRHYELTSDDPFGMRLVLVERSGLDEVSGVMRRTLDDGGVLAGELRGGIGYDRGRDMQGWRAGGSLLWGLTKASRLTLDFDVASESRTGLTGRRHATSAVLHVDL